MSDTKIWEAIAANWDDWGPPLRPCAADTAIYRRLAARWHAQNPVDRVGVFVCGVTPEIVTMDWPFAVDLVGMDQAQSMVRRVWPGDVAGVRRGLVGNWMGNTLEPRSRHVVVGDGGYGDSAYPNTQRALLQAAHRLLKPGGLLMYRLYAQAERREGLGEVIAAARAGQIGNFHVFKWRVAMALQVQASAGVRRVDIWQACRDAKLETPRLPQPGWSARAVDTIRFYEGAEARLYFPTAQEFGRLMGEFFESVELVRPEYELGERCPIFSGRARG